MQKEINNFKKIIIILVIAIPLIFLLLVMCFAALLYVFIKEDAVDQFFDIPQGPCYQVTDCNY